MAVGTPYGINIMNGLQVGANGSPLTRLVAVTTTLTSISTASQGAGVMSDYSGGITPASTVPNDSTQTGNDQDQIIWVHEYASTTGAGSAAICGIWWSGSGDNTCVLRFSNPTLGANTPFGGDPRPNLIGVY